MNCQVHWDFQCRPTLSTNRYKFTQVIYTILWNWKWANEQKWDKSESKKWHLRFLRLAKVYQYHSRLRHLRISSRSHAHTVVWECCKDDQQSQWVMLKFDPQLPLNPSSDRHQIWHAWLRHGYLSPRKKWAQSVKGFLLPIYAKYTPPMFATLCLLLFFGSSNHLQPRPLHGFLRLKRQTTRFCARKCLLRVIKVKLHI